MRFALNADHRDFFQKNNYIELEELLTPIQANLLRKHIERTLAARLQISIEKLTNTPAAELFQVGYDLWRDDETIRKSVHKRAYASLAAELLHAHALRLAFDAYIQTSKQSSCPFLETLPLQEISCLFPLVGGLILPLKDLEEPCNSFPLPLKAGNGLFISATLPIPWPQLFQTPGLHLLVVGFGQEKTFFRADTRDAHAIHLKKLGYVFNDLLREDLHPLLLRKNR